MSIFEKLNQARLEFQNMGVKKSGKNSYAGYTYYELSDIIPAINKLAEKLKFCCVINFTNDLAKLDFCDLEKDERITFTSPMSSASLKGCHEVQNLGAVETYIKRYLYQNCFEIVEGDALDSTMNPADEKATTSQGNEKIDDLIAQVKGMMNTFTDDQLDYANKAIKERDVKKLKIIIASKMAK
jgi:hypothetical protein